MGGLEDLKDIKSADRAFPGAQIQQPTAKGVLARALTHQPQSVLRRHIPLLARGWRSDHRWGSSTGVNQSPQPSVMPILAAVPSLPRPHRGHARRDDAGNVRLLKELKRRFAREHKLETATIKGGRLHVHPWLPRHPS